jgi:hypothetical protein
MDAHRRHQTRIVNLHPGNHLGYQKSPPFIRSADNLDDQV